MNCLKCGRPFSALQTGGTFRSMTGRAVEIETLVCPCGMNYAKAPVPGAMIGGIYGEYAFSDQGKWKLPVTVENGIRYWTAMFDSEG